MIPIMFVTVFRPSGLTNHRLTVLLYASIQIPIYPLSLTACAVENTLTIHYQRLY